MSFKRLKRITSLFLFAIALVVVSIVLIALVRKPFFLPVFGLFFLSWLFLFVNSFKFKFDNSEKILVSLLIITVTFSAVFFADSLKDYSDKTQELANLQSQISELSTQEAYASGYSEYFTTAIKQSEENSLALAKKINQLNVTKQEPIVVVPDPPIILNYRDYEEDDD